MRLQMAVGAIWKTSLAAGLGAAASFAAAMGAAQAQPNEMGIAAIVNDAIISTFDVEERVGLRIISSGQQPPPEVLQRLREQVLRDLIDEKLKLQEAAELGLEIPNDFVDARLAEQVFGGQGADLSSLEAELRSLGLSLNSLRDQVRAEIAWDEIVNGRFGNRIRVSDEQINQVMERMSRDANATQYRVSEIFIPMESQARAQQAVETANQLYQLMEQGTPFPALAQQFSAAPSAAVGGDIGWVVDGQLPAVLDRAIRTLETGQVSQPVVSGDGIYILALADKKELTGNGAWFELVQVMVEEGAGDDNRRRPRDILNRFIEAAGGCAGAERVIKDFPGVKIAQLTALAGDEIDPQFLRAMARIEPGEATEPVEIDGALHSLIICGRAGGRDLAMAMSHEAVRDRLFEQQLSMMSRRYLRDVRRDSTVELR